MRERDRQIDKNWMIYHLLFSVCHVCKKPTVLVIFLYDKSIYVIYLFDWSIYKFILNHIFSGKNFYNIGNEDI